MITKYLLCARPGRQLTAFVAILVATQSWAQPATSNTRLFQIPFDTISRMAIVEVRIGDGYDGWAEHAPFDAIIVTAAASHVPPPLLGQLKPGGRLVIPVGDRFFTQQLILIEKRDDGALTTTQVLPVRFVPLVRAE